VHSTHALLLHTGVFVGQLALLVHCTAVHLPAFGPVSSHTAVPLHWLLLVHATHVLLAEHTGVAPVHAPGWLAVHATHW
jgi:hypothetical protein